MSKNDQRSKPPLHKALRAGLACALLAGLLLSCRIVHSDKVEVGQGQVELVVSAEQNPYYYVLSPDGRWTVILKTRDGHNDPYLTLLNLTDGTERTVEPDPCDSITNVQWLNDSTFVTEGSPFRCYLLVDAPTLTATRIPRFPKEEMDGRKEIALIEQADQVYVVSQLGHSGYTVIALAESFQSVLILENLSYPDEQRAVLAAIPGVVFLEPSIQGITGDRVYSPDGKLYAVIPGIRVADDVSRLDVYTADVQLVAAAQKKGWYLSIEGWAHDGRGIYFSTIIQGSSAQVETPQTPLFKLSPAE